jgi:hypothetical protein
MCIVALIRAAVVCVPLLAGATAFPASAEVIAYDRHSGAMKKVFTAGPEVGGRAGLLDLTSALNATQRRDDSCMILSESNDQAKILIYEWDGK